MFAKPCRCGKTSKNFKKDIGPFFVNTCCKDAGYDHLGNRTGDLAKDISPAEKAPVLNQGAFRSEYEAALPTLLAPQVRIERKMPSPTDTLSKNKLKDLTLAQLNQVAADRGRETRGMTRQRIMDVLLGRG